MVKANIFSQFRVCDRHNPPGRADTAWQQPPTFSCEVRKMSSPRAIVCQPLKIDPHFPLLAHASSDAAPLASAKHVGAGRTKSQKGDLYVH